MNCSGHGLALTRQLVRGQNRAQRARLLGTRLGFLLATLWMPLPGACAQANSRPDRVSFRGEVAPILVSKCLGCHSDKKASSDLSMSTFAALVRGGKTTGLTILEPGDPDGSYLIESVRPGASPRMPYKLPPLKEGEIAVLTRWVKEGAKFDGPSESKTPLVSLVDILKDLPKVAVKGQGGDPVASLDYRADGRLLAAGIGRQVVLLDPESTKIVATLGDHPGPVNSVRFTPDGQLLVAAGGRAGLFGSVTMWDVAKKERRF
jgi:WD40 repeat protein